MTVEGGGVRKRRRKDPFVQVDRKTVRNDRMSFRALGLLTYALDAPANRPLDADSLSKAEGREGREAIRTAYRELAGQGHYRLERRILRNGRKVMGTAFSELPVESWIEDAAEYGNLAVPVVQQPDGTFKVRHKDGSLTSDGFEEDDESAPEVPEGSSERDIDAGETGDQKPVSGDTESISSDLATGDGFPGPGDPSPGDPSSGDPAAGGPSPGTPLPKSFEEQTHPEDSLEEGSDPSLRSGSGVTSGDAAGQDVIDIDGMPMPPAPKPRRRSGAQRAAEHQAAVETAHEVATWYLQAWSRARSGAPIPRYASSLQSLIGAGTTPENAGYVTGALLAGYTRREVEDALKAYGQRGRGVVPGPQEWGEMLATARSGAVIPIDRRGGRQSNRDVVTDQERAHLAEQAKAFGG